MGHASIAEAKIAPSPRRIGYSYQTTATKPQLEAGKCHEVLDRHIVYPAEDRFWVHLRVVTSYVVGYRVNCTYEAVDGAIRSHGDGLGNRDNTQSFPLINNGASRSGAQMECPTALARRLYEAFMHR